MFHPDYINPKKLIVNEDILKLFKIVEKHGGSISAYSVDGLTIKISLPIGE